MKEKTADIDILEELVNAYKDCFVENYNEMIVDVGMRYKDIQAISNLIAENKELKEKYSRKLIDFQKEREEYEKDYIQKSKVKAKIKQLDYNDIGNYERRCKQEVLQELLGKE